MNNLLMKELKVGINPFFYALAFLTSMLMLIPGWLYFIVPLYFCWITIPNMFAGYKTQNDLLFSVMMPVTRKDIVKAKVILIVILELLQIVTAVVFGVISTQLYPDSIYYFYAPTVGFWGLCFTMYAIFNIIFISMYYKTAYKYSAATIVGVIGAMLFATGAEWLGIKNEFVFNLFKGSRANSNMTQLTILIIGVLIFMLFTYIGYKIAVIRFKKVEV